MRRRALLLLLASSACHDDKQGLPFSRSLLSVAQNATKLSDARVLQSVSELAHLGELAREALARTKAKPPVTVSRGCLAHARYLMRNLNHPSTKGLGMHDEDPKLPGYTIDGRKAGGDSVIAAGMPPLASVDDWVGTFYHRIPLLDPNLGRIGFGFAHGGSAGWVTVLNATAGKGRDSAFLFPVAGQKDVPLRGVDAAGYPITLGFPTGRTVRNVQATLSREGKEVSVKLLVPESSEEAKNANAVVIVPDAPLAPGITYTMRVQARLDRRAWSQTWSFTTRRD